MEQLEKEKCQIDTSDQDAPVQRDEDTAEASDIETKECENTSTITRRSNIGKIFEHLDMKFVGKTYSTQFISIE